MKYSASLIGCGRVGVLLEEDKLRKKPASHIGGLLKLKSKVILDSLCDINKERLIYVSEKWKINNYYTDYKKLILERKPDIVIIATWTNTHKEIAEYCMKNGVKGMVLEKPVATSLKDAGYLLKLSEKYKTKIVVNHERRWDSLFLKTKEIIDNRELGKLVTIYSNVYTQSSFNEKINLIGELGGGVLLHDGTHLIDIIRYFAGDIKYVIGDLNMDKNAGVEKKASAFLLTENNVNVFLQAASEMDFFNFELDLIFKNGRIKIGNGIREYYTTESSKRYEGFKDLVKKEFPVYEKIIDPFSGAINEVIIAIEKDIEPYSSLIDGVKAMEVIFSIYHSHFKNNKRIILPLNNI